MISAVERLRLISEALGRNILLREITTDRARELWKREGWPEDTIQVTLWASLGFATNLGNNQRLLTQQEEIVARIIGRSPHTFSDWLDRNLREIK